MFASKTKNQPDQPSLQDIACQAVVDLDAKADALKADLARQEARAAELEKGLGEDLVSGSGTLESLSVGFLAERAKSDLLRSALAALERRRPALVEAIADARAEMLRGEVADLIRQAEKIETAARKHWEALAEIEFEGSLVGVGDVPRFQSKSETLRYKVSELSPEIETAHRWKENVGRSYLQNYRQSRGL